MNIQNCRECGNIFVYAGNPICNDCIRKIEEEFQKVKEYLRENEGASIFKVAEETQVEKERILEFLRQDRLVVKSPKHYLISCESCGEKIPSGRYCESCSQRLQDDLEGVIDRPKQEKKSKFQNGEKFRIADRYK